MKVATLIRLLKKTDQQADVMLEVVRGETRTRYHARDVNQHGVVGASHSATKSLKVVISSE